MKINEIIEKLPTKAKEYCETAKKILTTLANEGAEKSEMYTTTYDRLTGYIRCLEDMEVITDRDRMKLFIYCTM